MKIIELANFRKLEPAKDQLEYYCIKCTAGYWRLKADGRIFCGSCGALMRNLKVTGEPVDHLPA